MNKKFINNSFMFILFFMITIMCVNFVVDPGRIYLKKILADSKSEELAAKILNSKNGVVQKGWNERLVKTTLAKEAGKFDCVILGSSHIMQISSVRNTGNITKQCKNLLNLGVSGGSIEDVSIYTYLILNNIRLPNKVFISIDPWTLKFNMDSRYGAYKKYYDKMNVLLNNNDAGKYSSYRSKVLKNLFNGEYFYYSIISLFKKTDGKSTTSTNLSLDIVFPRDKYTYSEGYKDPVTLNDGSHVYASKYILNAKIKTPGIGGGAYKISSEVYQIKTLEYLQKIVDLYENNGINIKIVLTPYHPNAFKKGVTKTVKHLKIVEKISQEFAINNNLKLYGSYFPDKLGCKGKEFFDVMHPTNECLNKIDFSK